MDQHKATGVVVQWALSTPVLAWRLSMIARDGMAYGDGDQELTCTVADLLDPDRKTPWPEYLHATRADAGEADAAWRKLGGIAGIYAVDWVRVRQTLLDAEASWVAK